MCVVLSEYLKEHVEAALVLRERVTGDFVKELLEPLPTLLDEPVLKQTLVASAPTTTPMH